MPIRHPSKRPTRAPALVALLAVAAVAAFMPVSSPGSSAAAGERLPDLDQEVPTDIRVLKVDRPNEEIDRAATSSSWRLGFRSAVRNVGQGPLIIQGHRSDLATPTMTADQMITRADGTSAVVPGIGTLQYVRSPDHEHWHYLAFDRYEVYELRRAGKPRILVFDQKTGFCLGDRYPMTPVSVAGAQPLPLFIGSCGLGKPELLDIVEGISVGWGDDYRAFLEGQDLALDGLPGGRYELIHRVNSDRKLRELSYANNAASLLLDLRWTSAGPTVRVLASCPDTERCAAP